jgi:GntR family transcriptional regulator
MSKMPHKIDFESHVPYYAQLINLLKEQIDQKVWNPGDQIPGEPELCREYGVSRTVVRQTLSELEQDGLIVRRKGRGTFVAIPKISEGLAQKLTGFYQDMVTRGFKPVTQVLRQEVIPANEKIAGYLEIALGALVVVIKRLRFVNDQPIQLVTSYLPYALVPSLATVDLTNRSLYEYLEQDCNLFISRGRRFIEAVLANEAEANQLQIERGAALVMLDSVSYLDDGRPIEYYHALHRGDRSRFEIELVRVRQQNNPVDLLSTEPNKLPQSTDIIP